MSTSPVARRHGSTRCYRRRAGPRGANRLGLHTRRICEMQTGFSWRWGRYCGSENTRVDSDRGLRGGGRSQ